MNDLRNRHAKAVWVGIALVALAIGTHASLIAQSQATYGQQIAVLKMLNPNLKRIGVLGSRLSEKEMQNILRSGLGQDVEIFFGRPRDLRDIAQIYKKLIADKGVQMIWIPDHEDDMLVEDGFEFLRSKSLDENIGLCVPTLDLVTKGGLCTVQRENGKLVLHVNHRIADMIGRAVPQNSLVQVLLVSN